MVAVCLTACASDEQFSRPVGEDVDAYAAMYPYYAEYCALSQIKEKPDFGARIRGEIGGHSVFYLNGACRDTDTDYPVIHVCDPASDARNDGVGLSMNAHFRNAKWVAVPGRDFFFNGDLRRDQGLTLADYDRAQAHAKALGLYRDIVFHTEVFKDKPDNVSKEDYKYEVSIATDYAISYGRGRFCARVPVTRAQMATMVTFLNAQNAPYRDGSKTFDWSVFQDNCIHMAHNALAAAGVWPVWPTDLPLVFAIFDFPVPKNEFVNLMLRMNNAPELDPDALYHDDTARRSVLEFGRLPWEPGALAEARGPQEPNALYDTDLKLIFYEDPVFQVYQHHFDTILSDPRYFDTERNLDYFAGLYRRMQAERQPLATLLAREDFQTQAQRQRFTEFYDRLYAYVDREHSMVAADLNQIRTAARPGDRLMLLSQSGPR